VEEDLVRGAADALADVGPHNVELHVADGRDGWPDGAPYDCVIATVGVTSVPPSWRSQVDDGGRLLVPLLDPRVLRVERRRGDEWEVEATSPAAFIPLR
jgi:protein-L-isoaspartate(D-aspartate) O-methyltransferase